MICKWKLGCGVDLPERWSAAGDNWAMSGAESVGGTMTILARLRFSQWRCAGMADIDGLSAERFPAGMIVTIEAST